MRIPDPGPQQCHPRIGDIRPPEGCLPRDILEMAATALNLTIPKSTIALRKQLENIVKVKPINE